LEEGCCTKSTCAESRGGPQAVSKRAGREQKRRRPRACQGNEAVAYRRGAVSSRLLNRFEQQAQKKLLYAKSRKERNLEEM
jgi:hypothetical protein